MATNKTLNPTGVTIAIPAMADKPDASVFSNCIDKEADAINTLNSNFTTPIKLNPSVVNNNITIVEDNSYLIGKMAFVAIRMTVTGDIPTNSVFIEGFPLLKGSSLGSGSSAMGVSSNKKRFSMSANGQLMTAEILTASDGMIVLNCAYVIA